MTPSPRYVPRRIGHHAAHSGYDRLFEHMGLQAASSPWALKLADALPGALAWRLWAMRPQATNAVGLRTELGAMPYLAAGRNRLCHFIYGEDTYFLTPLWKRSSNRTLATFHYPPERLATRINAGSVRGLGAAIMVGENQREFLEQLLPPERVHYCPHAVDTAFFQPTTSAAETESQDTLRLVCAGSTFRDHATLREVHLAVRSAGYEVQTDVISPRPKQQVLLDGVPGIHIHRDISDEALRSLYCNATVGVLPLFNATANNALLELLACGRPVVVSDVGGLAAYTRGSAAHLVPAQDVDAMAATVIALLKDAPRRALEGALNRQHAEQQLGFEPVAARMRSIYAACAAAV